MHAELYPLEIECAAVAEKLRAAQDFLLIDCREQPEYDVARIAGARLMPMSKLADQLSALEPYRQHEIAVHCHHGGRSLRVTQWLREQGFAKVRNMSGGIDQWSQDIDPNVPRY